MIVSAFNPDTSDLEKTYLSDFAGTGETVLKVKNNDRFIVGRRILIGQMSGEKSELGTVSAINPNKLAITLSPGLLFDHNADTSIFLLTYDKVRFYRRATQASAPSLQVTVDIDVDNIDGITRWDDTSSTTANWYQYSWYNSITDEESELSDPVQSTGYVRKNIGAIIDGVVRRVRDTSFNVLTFEEYIDIANEVGDDLITQAQKPYIFLKRSIKLDTVTGQNYIDILDQIPDFWKFDYVEVATVSAGEKRYREMLPLSFDQFQQRYNVSPSPASNTIVDIAFDNETSRLYFSPVAQDSLVEMFIFHYYKTFTELRSSGDIVETPNPTIYRYKLMAEYYAAKAEVDNQWMPLMQRYDNMYGNEIVKMQRVNRRDVGTPRSFRPPRAYRRRRYTL